MLVAEEDKQADISGTDMLPAQKENKPCVLLSKEKNSSADEQPSYKWNWGKEILLILLFLGCFTIFTAVGIHIIIPDVYNTDPSASNCFLYWLCGVIVITLVLAEWAKHPAPANRRPSDNRKVELRTGLLFLGTLSISVAGFLCIWHIHTDTDFILYLILWGPFPLGVLESGL